jgi:hypothetical protein
VYVSFKLLTPQVPLRELDQTFFRRALCCASVASRQNNAVDPDLKQVWDSQYMQHRSDALGPLVSRSGRKCIITTMSLQLHVNCKNHVVVNFTKRLRCWTTMVVQLFLPDIPKKWQKRLAVEVSMAVSNASPFYADLTPPASAPPSVNPVALQFLQELVRQRQETWQHLLPLSQHLHSKWWQYLPWLDMMLSDGAMRNAQLDQQVAPLAAIAEPTAAQKKQLKQLNKQRFKLFSLLPRAALTPMYIPIDTSTLKVRKRR